MSAIVYGQKNIHLRNHYSDFVYFIMGNLDDPLIHIYRHVEYDYKKKDITYTNDICKCPCVDFGECYGLDAIRYDFCGKKQNKPQCRLCTSVSNVVLNSRQSLRNVLLEGSTKYRQTKRQGLNDINKSIDALHEKRALFEAQAHKIRALKQKIHVATEVLHTATGKLSHLGSSFNTLDQQNGLQYKDTVQVGIPYLPPFFTLSNRNYVIMMVCINILLLIAIIVYAFMNRVRTDFDVVSTDLNKKPVETPSKAKLSNNAEKNNMTEVNQSRGGHLNSQDYHPNSLTGMNGHLYQ